jgi:hypothetical protein
MHKLKKLKTKSCVRLIHLLLFIFSLIDSLIKQQTAWSQGSSKYQKQKKCTRSEISINLSFYVYIIPKRNNYSSNSNIKKKENGYNQKRKMATILKLAIKNIYPNYQHYTDIDPSVNTQPHISCL